ncbi:hypothetical protein [Rhodonellum sp.]|uniref:hypothetical protein n=1 Tax=Rhodonellum sp. TaxID=2231180 RepID=UPI0027176A6D|nr:hypothetical protein [Rhodonellum sp.]MDO9553325.1 hypothetical protein [Rhodonellum sp.]
MANEKNKLDTQFREKLINHQEKPSALAWERLENQLSKSEQKNGFPFWKIAASLLLLMGMGYFIWLAVDSTNPSTPELAAGEQEKIQDSETLPMDDPSLLIQEKLPSTEETSFDVKEESKQIQKQNSLPQKKSITPRKEENQASLIAGVRKPEESLEMKGTEIPEIEIPIMDIAGEPERETLAKNEAPLGNEDAYRVKIISNGFLAEAEKPGLIEEIETKIEKIGGLLNKVDQGFADLQDAKNNLFASMATKKEKNN